MKMKKFICILLTAVLLVSVFSLPAIASTEYTIKFRNIFDNDLHWDKVYLFTSKENDVWSEGKELTKPESGYLYEATIDTDVICIMFKSSLEENAEQTVKIACDNTVSGYYPTLKNGEGKWEIGSWIDNKVFFKNTQKWEQVYLYAFKNNYNNAEFPGVEIKEFTQNSDGINVYEAYFDSVFDKIIFSNGKKSGEGLEQTVDITYDPKVTGYYPTDKNTEGKWNFDSWTDKPDEPDTQLSLSVNNSDSFKKLTYGKKKNKYQIKASATEGAKISYSCNNKKVAAVNNKGLVTVKGCGNAKIKVTAVLNNQTKNAEFNLTVKPDKLKIEKKKSKKKSTGKLYKKFVFKKQPNCKYQAVIEYKRGGKFKVLKKKIYKEKKIKTYKKTKGYIEIGFPKGYTFSVKIRAYTTKKPSGKFSARAKLKT